MSIRTLGSAHSIALENARFMSRVYRWMSLGILITAFVSYFVAATPEIMDVILSSRALFWVLVIAQLGAVIFLTTMIQKIRAATAIAIYLGYAALTGLTFSVIFLIYTQESIVNVFLTTAFAFAGLSAFGYFTKKDLGPVGSFCTMGLFGLIGFSILSFFIPSLSSNSTVQFAYSIIGLVVFAGLTAYDTQKIKAMNIIGNEGSEEDTKEAVIGALTLYLDFINLFLMLLRLSGGRRRD